MILYIQGAATLLGVLGLTLDIKTRFDHGQDVNPLAYVLTVVSIIVGAAAIVCAAMIVAQKRYWVRQLVAIIEVIAVLYGLINVVTGVFTGVVGIALAVAVLVLAFRSEVTAWINGPAPDNSTR